jgi:hypothetical protein
MKAPPADLNLMHRWFAVECNNEAWNLYEQASRSPQEDQRMLHLAHAAVLHWEPVGKLINQARGANLLAVVYARLGQPGLAVAYAENCLAWTIHAGEDATPFDHSAAYGCAAAAYAAVGQREQAEAMRGRCLDAAQKCDDPGDREVIERLFLAA